ncbi:hypothetical protein HY945_02830 [Candidatus Gottesmanbacteria bacterium]|nr:hypothetical protein [Candidatus Gottesmanbacteria bacterium]
MRKDFIYIILAILTLPIVLFAGRQIQQLLSRAAPKAANIVVDTKNIIGPLNKSWTAFAQGGEEPPPMLTNVVSQLRQINPKYIRLDHIYDSYSVVRKKDNNFVYDFGRLDQTVDDIIASGGLPFFSLSYMPSIFTSSNSIIDPPSDWENWKNLVKATVEHYSGKNNRNLNNIYYEVWNEPELSQFGDWKLEEGKDYRLLYFYAEKGAKEAENINNFYIGGPAVGSYYSAWVNDFLSYVNQNNLRLDFYSWHRYTKRPYDFLSDSQKIRKDLSAFPKYAGIPLILTEWGIESGNLPINNSDAAAAFTINALSYFNKDINLAFAFEVKDGPPPAGGKWGLLTHEKNTNQPLSPKPRYRAFETLSKMSGNQLFLDGNGTFVSGLASTFNNTIKVVLSNYDPASKNTENVPITFAGLNPASYSLAFNYPLIGNSGKYELTTTDGIISKTFIMQPNSILYLELIPTASIATFIPGPSGKSSDQAIVLKNNNSPLIFTAPEFHLLPTGSISFDIKPFLDEKDNRSYIIFESPFIISDNLLSRLFLAKQFTSLGNLLVFGTVNGKESTTVSQSIDNLQSNQWHRITSSWNQSGLSLSIDGISASKETILDIRNGKILTFYPIEAALDNLKIAIGDQLIERTFDTSVDK